ncbi:hypothetical protein VPHG_00153 [Vibrio phage 11895-B1]|uniref:hypothetical protein n=1 Tax=Vibrio phage 11895-B1 TaxID=754075 RepID=UPI0002C09DF5|nr:hypothetical protein VPHG_00153 [Vibrio phage 11895-B1]AGH32217.1 hypothetical protein VPHG_00153 [Vibrio phage 11895-B1]
MANVNKGKIMTGVRKSGAPDKKTQLDNKIKRAEEKMEELKVKLKVALTEGNQQIIENYLNYIQFLDDVAQGRVKEASVTARIGACDKLIKRVDELREELEMDNIDPDSVEVEEESSVEVDVSNLIQIDFLG